MMNKPQTANFLYRVKQLKKESNGCILWIGAKNRQGYGLAEYTDATGKRRCTTASRLVYMADIGIELERWQFVLHSCDTPACVNRRHLWLGTAKHNSEDMLKKGRGCLGQKREYHNRVRDISNEKVIAIFLDEGKYCDLAKKYAVSQTYVSDVKSGRIKRLITEPLRHVEGGRIWWCRARKIIVPVSRPA